jgi:hypothetical protein
MTSHISQTSTVQAIALAHYDEDAAQLADDARLTEGPIGYLTGACTITSDLRRMGYRDADFADLTTADLDQVRAAVVEAYRDLLTAHDGRPRV